MNEVESNEIKLEVTPKEPFTTTEWYRLGKGYIVNNYHVVSKDLDPYNAYDFDEVKAFCMAHPELENVPKDHIYDDEMNLHKLLTSEDRKLEISARLAQIDSESLRAVRATLVKKNTTKDDKKLIDLETEATDLRNELSTL